MATRIYAVKEIELQDGTEVILKPLPIGKLRRFQDAWEKIGALGDTDDGFDVFVNCSGIALEENFKGRFDSMRASKDEQADGEVLSEEYKNYLMDVLDVETIYEILLVCGGINLRDPKLQEAAQEALAGQSLT